MSHETEHKVTTPQDKSAHEIREQFNEKENPRSAKWGRGKQVGVAATILTALAVGSGLTMNALSGESKEAPEPGTRPTVEAPVVPGETPAPVETSEPAPTSEPTVETEPTVGNLEFRESDLTPEVLASLSDAEIIERMQIPIAEFPTVEDWAEQYVLRDNDVMRSGTAPSEITTLFDIGGGMDAMNSIVDRYASLSGQALRTSPEQYESSDILHLAIANASQAHYNGETYIIREDLESVEVTAGSAEEGAFSASIIMRRQDNMGDLEITKKQILENTGNTLRTLSTDVDIYIKVDVVNIDGLWKVASSKAMSSTPHEK